MLMSRDNPSTSLVWLIRQHDYCTAVGVSTWMQFFILTDLSGKMVSFDGIWKCPRMTRLYRADGRQHGWVVCLWQRCGLSGGVLVDVLWTHTCPGAFYSNAEIQWRNPKAHCCAIHLRPSPHIAAWSFCAHMYTISGPVLACPADTLDISPCLGCSGSTYTSMSSSFWHDPATLHSCFRGLDWQSRATVNNPINSMWYWFSHPRGVFHCGLLEAHLFAH